MSQILINALRETLFMLAAAGSLSILIGVPLGMLIANISNSPYKYVQVIYYVLFNLIKVTRTIPFLLIMVLFIPITNWLISKQFSYTFATIMPLATAGALILTVKVNDITFDLLQKWSATSRAMGATLKQKLALIILPDALPQIIQESANTCSLLVGFSTIAGALGAGGLGQLAIEKSINNPDPLCVIISIVALVALQQLIKYTGNLVVQQA